MAPKSKRPPPITQYTQRRGDHRRGTLLRAASDLLEKIPLRELTYAGVCKRAGIPVGSAHHFYPDLDSIFLALLERHRAAKDAAIFKPIPARYRNSWQAVIACLIDRAVRYHRANPVVTKLAIGGDTPPNIKLLDRHADRARADLSMHLLDQLFVVPAFADKERAAFLATEIVDTALTLSMIETGRLTATYVRLAKAAAIGFLMMQFGPELPVKHGPAGGSTA
jgi:AcrR family transcriptional regulator